MENMDFKYVSYDHSSGLFIIKNTKTGIWLTLEMVTEIYANLKEILDKLGA